MARIYLYESHLSLMSSYATDRALPDSFADQTPSDDEFYARPSPIEVLADVVRGLITPMSRRLSMWLRPSRIEAASDDVLPTWSYTLMAAMSPRAAFCLPSLRGEADAYTTHGLS